MVKIEITQENGQQNINFEQKKNLREFRNEFFTNWKSSKKLANFELRKFDNKLKNRKIRKFSLNQEIL